MASDNINRTSRTPESIEGEFRIALNRVIHDVRFTEGEFAHVLGFIAKTTADVLNCVRASIWSFEKTGQGETQLRSLIEYDQADGESSEDYILNEADAGSYVKALKTESLLIINDVNVDPRCVELTRDYLPARNIRAMLDTTYQYNGELAGVLCLEHLGEPRRWTTAEQHFITNMGSLLTIASEREHRRQTESALREEEDRYRSLVHDLPMGIVMIIDRKILFANLAAAEITQVNHPEALVGMSMSDILPTAEADEFDAWEAELQNPRRAPKEYRLRLRNDSVLTLEVTTTPVNWYGRAAIQVIFRDITQSYYSQQRLKRSERLLSQAQKIARMSICNTDWKQAMM